LNAPATYKVRLVGPNTDNEIYVSATGSRDEFERSIRYLAPKGWLVFVEQIQVVPMDSVVKTMIDTTEE
jgi:hypothetical protein